MDSNKHHVDEPVSLQRRRALTAAGVGLLLGLAGPTVRAQSASAATGNGKILIAYFSWTGNTRALAGKIQNRIGGELFEIRAVHPYPQQKKALGEQAKREQAENFRPQLVSEVPNFDAYEDVFVGFPIWWGTLPMALFSFLEKHDFAGKRLIPFCTQEGSGLERSVTDLRALCPTASVREGIALRGKEMSSMKTGASPRALDAWLRRLSNI
jgi:flavodoxin